MGGVSISDLNNKFKVKEISLNPYLPSKFSEVNQNNLDSLSWLLLKWHPQTCYYYSVEHGGFEASPERTPEHIQSTIQLMTKLMIFITIQHLLNLVSEERPMMQLKK